MSLKALLLSLCVVVPATAQQAPFPSGGPLHGLPTLPTRPIVAGYLNSLRSASGGEQSIADLPSALQAANLEAYDIIITAFAEPKTDGSVGTGIGSFSTYLPAVVTEGHALGKTVLVSIGGANPASLANQFATIAASATLRQTFANNVVTFLAAHGLDGVDIDYEFPADATARANFTLLMQTLHDTVKVADPRYIVMFAGGPGWFLGSYDFAALHLHTDFFFYFGYDWKNPENGPMLKPGSVQWTLAGEQLPQASVKGGIDHVLGKGFPASKILCGLPFYGSANTSWSAVRNTWAANQAAYTAATDPDSMETLIAGEWFTTPEGLKRKMDALLTPGSSVLAGGAVLRGTGCWEIGHEHASHPDLSAAFAEWTAAAGSSGDGWTSHLPEGSSGTSYATWAAAHGAGSALSDSDGDGSVNVLEFLFSATPESRQPVSPHAEIRILSVAGVEASYFCLSIDASSSTADAEYRAVASDDLDFSAARVMVLQQVTDLGGGRVRALWRDAQPLSGAKAMGRIEARMKP